MLLVEPITVGKGILPLLKPHLSNIPQTERKWYCCLFIKIALKYLFIIKNSI